MRQLIVIFLSQRHQFFIRYDTCNKIPYIYNLMRNKILIVDDEPNSVEPMMMLFEDEGYKIRLMDTHAGIFNVIDEFEPNLILLDVFLNGSDGRYICNLLKSIDKTGAIPIVLISGMTTRQEILDFDIQTDGFLQKPFNLDECLEKVKSLLD